MRKAMKKFAASMIALAAVMAILVTYIPSEAAAKAPKKITLNTGAKTIDVKSTLTVSVKSVTPSNASKSVSYKSSNKKVATVSSKGVVTGKKVGKATITVTSKVNKKVKKTVKITVKDLKPTSISASNIKLETGKTKAIKATVKPAGVYCPLSYSTSDASVATVSSKGVVTAKKAGKATISIKSKEKNSKKKYITKKITVTVVDAVEKVEKKQVFVSPKWVNAVINKQVAGYENAFISEVSWGTADGAEDDYTLGHVPGAYHINTDAVEYDDCDPWPWGDGKDDFGLYDEKDVSVENNFNIRSDEQIATFLKRNNITKDTKVILYGKNAQTDAVARVAFVMLYAGVEDVKVIDGGMKAWKAEKLPLETTRNEQIAGGDDYNFGAKVPVNKNYIMDIDTVNEKLQNDPNFRLVSIRSKEEFEGKTSGYQYIVDDHAGEPKGAIWGHNIYGEDAPYVENDKTASLDVLNKYLAESNSSTNNELSFYCGTGWRACIPFLMCYQAGKEDISVYDGGWYLWALNHWGDSENNIAAQPEKYQIQQIAPEEAAKNAGLKFESEIVETDIDGLKLTSSKAEVAANKLLVNGYEFSGKVTYASSNEAVATVNEAGKVTTTGYGEAVITATAEKGATASYTVKVTDRADKVGNFADWGGDGDNYKVELNDELKKDIDKYIILDTRQNKMNGRAVGYDDVRFKSSVTINGEEKAIRVVPDPHQELYPLTQKSQEDILRKMIADDVFAGDDPILIICMGGQTGARRSISILEEAGIASERIKYLVGGGGAMVTDLQSENPIVEKPVKEAKVQSGTVTGNIDMTKYEAGKVVRVWLPIPQDDEYQTITNVSGEANGGVEVKQTTDAKGNKMYYIEWGAEAVPADRTASYTFHVVRKEVLRPELKEEGTVDTEEFAQYLEGSSKVNVTDESVKTLAAEITKDQTTVLGKARAIYDWIYASMVRDNDVEGCGQGDIVELIKEGNRKGKCTDINSVFVGLCRASGVPARERFGIRINADDITGNQHCWAEFYLPGTGWVGADVADVLKYVLGNGNDKDSAGAKEMLDYYWGNTDEKRVQLTVGRDVVLEPAQAGEALNTFGYPYAEVDGTKINCYEPQNFVYTYSFAQDK